MDIVLLTTIITSLFLVIAAAEPLAARLRLPYTAMLAVLGIRPDGRKEATLVRLDDSTPNGSSVVFTVETDMVVLDSDNQWGMAHPSPNGGLFVIDQTGRLVEFGPTGQVVAEYDVPEGDATAITLDPSGNKLAMSFLEGGVTIVDLANGVIEEVPGNHVASSLGFNGDGTVLGISVWGGEIRLHEVGSGTSAPIIWDGTGTYGAEPGWYDAETDSLWLPASGKVLQIPLGTDRWIAQACKIVGRVLTPDEWDRNVPGDQPLRSVCT